MAYSACAGACMDAGPGVIPGGHLHVGWPGNHGNQHGNYGDHPGDCSDHHGDCGDLLDV